MATTPTELAPGSPAPGVQVPESQTVPLAFPLGLENPQIVNQPPAGLPNADISAPFQKLAALQMEPLNAGGAAGINIGQASRDLPLSLAGSQQPNQANVVPLIAFPVLSRLGPQSVSWAASVAIAGLTTINVRGTYRDLKITPGFRGIQIQYGAAAGAVTIKENTTGMVYTLPTGPQTIFLPLIMLREVFDLTITGPGATAFPAGSTCLLTTEEQLPFIMA